jgi:hypothetical protein
VASAEIAIGVKAAERCGRRMVDFPSERGGFAILSPADGASVAIDPIRTVLHRGCVIPSNAFAPLVLCLAKEAKQTIAV